jgi:phosphate/sulfate permease
MDTGFALALALAFLFALTNGIHDASNAIATLVATRAARPAQAVVLAAVFNVLGPLVVGAVVAALLLADGRIAELAPPVWVELTSALALTVGTAFGGWRIVKTVGRRIYRIRPVDGLASGGAAAGVILGASLVGGPVSTTQVVASSVVGVGGGRRRWHHVHWAIVRHMGLAWLVTMPATAALAAVALVVWRWLA